MVDPTSDPIDGAYSHAESLLNEQAERSARRARVLDAVAQNTVIGPVSRQQSMARVSRGGWLVAASVMIVSGFLVIKFLPLHELWSSHLIAGAPVAKLLQKDEMTAALSPPAATIDQSKPAPVGPKSKALDQAPNVARERTESSVKRTVLAAPALPPSVVAPPPVAASPPPLPAIFGDAPRAAPAVPLAAPPPPAMAAAAPPPPAARVLAMAAPPPRPAAAPPAPPAPLPPARSSASVPSLTTDVAKPNGGLSSNPGFDQLRAAAAAGRTIEVQQLLDSQIPVDGADADGETALMKSIRADQPATAALLIHRGASLDKKNSAGLSPRDLAIQINDPALNHALGLDQ